MAFQNESPGNFYLFISASDCPYTLLYMVAYSFFYFISLIFLQKNLALSEIVLYICGTNQNKIDMNKQIIIEQVRITNEIICALVNSIEVNELPHSNEVKLYKSELHLDVVDFELEIKISYERETNDFNCYISTLKAFEKLFGAEVEIKYDEPFLERMIKKNIEDDINLNKLIVKQGSKLIPVPKAKVKKVYADRDHCYIDLTNGEWLRVYCGDWTMARMRADYYKEQINK